MTATLDERRLGFRYAIEVYLSVAPSEKQKTELMMGLDNVIEKTLGKPDAGTIGLFTKST